MAMSDAEAKRIQEAQEANSLHNAKDINMETVDDVQGAARDLQNENLFSPDDNVVLRNIFNGETINGIVMPKLSFTFGYNGVKYETKPGQQFRLPGSQAYLYVKHLVSLIYRRLENQPENDRRTYPLTDKWVSKLIVRVDHTLAPEGLDRNEVQQIPDFYQDDGGRIANAAGNTGGGEVSLGEQVDDSDVTDEQFDKTPDFDPSKNPNVQFDADGKPIDTEAANKVNAPSGDEAAFPDAKQNQSEKSSDKKPASRQSKK